jgi:hypothetical protein
MKDFYRLIKATSRLLHFRYGDWKRMRNINWHVAMAERSSQNAQASLDYGNRILGKATELRKEYEAWINQYAKQREEEK